MARDGSTLYVALNGGRFISRGRGRHPTRRIDSHELVYVVGGRLDIFEQDREYRVEAGERLLLFPGRLHGGRSNYSRTLSFCWLHFRPRTRGAADRLARLPSHAAVAHPDLYASYWQLWLAEQRLRDDGHPDRSAAMDRLTDILLLEEPVADLAAQTPAVRRLAEGAQRLVKVHFAEPLATSDIAQRLRCHPDYLGRIFRDTYHYTIGDAIRRARIAKARRLLEESRRAIKEIAAEVGYTDVSYFRKQFFRECAVTPHRYRLSRMTGHVNTE